MIGRNALVQIIMTLLGSLIGFFTLSLSAKFFGAGTLGNLAYLLSLTGIIFSFSDLGFSQAHIRLTAAENSAAKTLGTFIRIKMVLMAMAGFAVLVLAAVNPGFFKGVFILILAYEILSRLAESLLITFEGLQRSFPQNTVRLISKIFKLAAVIFFGMYVKNILGYTAAYVTEATVLIIFSLWLVRHFRPGSFDGNLAKKYFNYSLPFFAIVPLSYFSANIVTILLRINHSATEIGFYTAAASLAGYIKDLFGAMMIYFFPKIAFLYHRYGQNSIQRYPQLALKYLLTIFMPIFTVSFLLRREIIQFVFGNEFIPAVPAFVGLLLGMFILMLFNPYNYVLMATDSHRSLVKVNIIGSALTVLLSIFFTFPVIGMGLGAVGAAYTYTIVWLITGMWGMFLVRQKLKIKFPALAFPMIVPAIFLAAVAEMIFHYIPAGLEAKLLVSLVAVFIYLILIYMLKLITFNDIAYFINLLWQKRSQS